jgi:colicin import membrane protein
MSEKAKKPIFKRWWFWLIVIVFIVAIASQGGNDDKEEVASGNVSEQIENNVENTAETDEVAEEVEEPKNAEKTERVEEPTESTIVDKEEATNETLSQKNAVRKAKEYLSVMAFSKEGLIKQLEFEGFSNEDATYAVNQIDVDWKEQAVKKAKRLKNKCGIEKG